MSATLLCAECGRRWLDTGERWIAPLAVGDEENEDALEAAVFCPDCFNREFGA